MDEERIADGFRKWIEDLDHPDVQVRIEREGLEIRTSLEGLASVLWDDINDRPDRLGYDFVITDGRIRWAPEVIDIFGDRPGVLLQFADASEVVLPHQSPDAVRREIIDQVLDARGRRPAVDVGLALLEPVTVMETRAIESLLTLLWRSVDDGSLTDGQRAQILSMADLLRSEQRDAVPGKTPRFRLVGVAMAVFTLLGVTVPEAVTNWDKASDILHDVDWHHVAEMLPGGEA